MTVNFPLFPFFFFSLFIWIKHKEERKKKKLIEKRKKNLERAWILHQRIKRIKTNYSGTNCCQFTVPHTVNHQLVLFNLLKSITEGFNRSTHLLNQVSVDKICWDNIGSHGKKKEKLYHGYHATFPCENKKRVWTNTLIDCDSCWFLFLCVMHWVTSLPSSTNKIYLMWRMFENRKTMK